MTPFERIAIFTMIEGIEGQLRGLKGLLASTANQASATTHKVTDTLGSTGELTDDEEAKLAAALEADRSSRIAGLKTQGENTFLEELTRAAGGIPPPAPVRCRAGAGCSAGRLTP